MIKQEERIKLNTFYDHLYEYLYNNFRFGRINITNMYKKTNAFKTHPYWLYFPSYKIRIGIPNVDLIVKFDKDQLGFEYKIDNKYFASLKMYIRKIESLRKYSKEIRNYECMYEETETSLFIHINIPHIDIHKDLNEQTYELTFLGNALFDFCWFHRRNCYQLRELAGF